MPTIPPFDDLNVFTNPAEFGTVALLPFGKRLAGIFNSPFSRQDIGNNQVNSQLFEFICQERAVVDVLLKEQAIITIDCKRYRVMRLEPDGCGMVAIILEPAKILEGIVDDDIDY